MKLNFDIDFNHPIPFNNNVTYCVGTGRMGLALHKEYWDQLAFVQKKIGFSYIRGHGLFCDDMAIYQEYKDKDGKIAVEYNFTYLDRVIDNYLELHIRPFLELGFMPEKLASGTQTQFYWKGNVTPPKEYDRWCGLVQATLTHLISRYGEKEVLSWPIEVWNEPNLTGFWENADMLEYCKLYSKTVQAIKEVHPALQVGGPAICGGNDEVWMRGFLTYCQENQVPLDFITRHHYTIHQPVTCGHYEYAELETSEYAFSTLQRCREIIGEFKEYEKLPFYITEFNTAYVPDCPLHDTNENAAYLARMLSEIGDYCTGYSYWTFGDVFEEKGVPYTPFYGGFGLVAVHSIPKPTFWIFQFYKDLTGTCVFRNEHSIICKNQEIICGILWNLSCETGSDLLALQFNLQIPVGEYCYLQKTVDETTCNPRKTWHDMGEPFSLNSRQTELLRDSARTFFQTEGKQVSSHSLTLDFSLDKNSVVYFELFPIQKKSDRGFEYGR